MKLSCSQCGAKLEIDSFKRFLHCPYCQSSLVVEKDRTVECYILKHIRNDIWVKGVFRAWLKKSGTHGDIEGSRIEFKYFPVWHATLDDGQTITQPAANTLHTEISSVKIPAGDIKYFDNDTSLSLVIQPSIRHEAATGWTMDIHDQKKEVKRLWLVYLPIYFIDYQINGERHRVSIVGESTRIYSDTAAISENYKIPVKNLVFFGIAFGTFLFLGFLFSTNIFIKAGAIAVAAVLFSVAAKFYLKK
jgi:DNA-directed RNA polymerase subunit RPC12/RpoP